MDKISLFLEQDSQKISSEGSTQVAAQKFSEGTEFAEDRLADFTPDRTDDGGTDRLGCLLAGIGRFLLFAFFLSGFFLSRFLRFLFCCCLFLGFLFLQFSLFFGFLFL